MQGSPVHGALGGLVGITAGAAAIPFGASILVGGIAGALVVFSIILIERARVDDPVGAISVHGTAGIWGVLAVGIWGGADFLTQATGVAAIIGWVFVTSLVVFKGIDIIHGMRVSEEEEHMGLDRSEHGGEAYPEFTFQETIAPPELLDPVGSDGT